MIIVFGGTGMLGQHTALDLIENGERVVVTGMRRHAPLLMADAVERKQAFVEYLDLTDPYAVMGVVAKYKPKVVVDTSGYAPKLLAPSAEVRARVTAELNLLEAAKLNGVERVVLTSSSDAYWGLGPECMPLKEDMPVPLQEDDDNFIVQSWAKKTLEVVANLYRRQEGLNIVTVRCSGMFGPAYRTFLNLPSRLIKAGLSGATPDFSKGGGVPVESDGYDQTYVKDIAYGMGLIVRAPTLQHHIYNLGSGRATSYGEIARAVEKAIPGFEIRLRPAAQPSEVGPGREVSMGNFYMDISRIGHELGYAPRYSMERAIAEYADWLRTHEM
ncbi:NAD-dependent epimerase/dehydratase family protein [Paraburkholderia elongata]|uniref:UDP-glucose 4-epimerase n=1 Tax=Paraburkholderia elongata TaxID=2675747 RepID=A0A972NMC3_9BURK|nr:NAD(P)-dependent oxidoreductase [Paraburkholderia elongata]NPT54923.1 NAD-dependent epimerase/dehydratase family protein [Paraburkholderia elongata]NPT60952.1 NAD-dependent epimerase/dehydratase family protein [Paraburkholderia elongata]